MKQKQFPGTGRVLQVSACLMLAGSLSVSAAVPGYLVNSVGKQIGGNISWSSSRKVYTVTRGQSQVPMPLDQVTDVLVKEPPELSGAIRSAKNKSYGAAIGPLKKIVDDYEMLKYDAIAATWLAKAYIETNNPKEAQAVINKVTRHRSPNMIPGELKAMEIEVLIANKMYSVVDKKLSSLIQSGDRMAVGIALTKRGDLKMEQENYKEALVDGYLRVVTLYREVQSVQPEALFKAAKCFEQLGQHTYAERMRKQLLERYGQSSFASQVRAGS